MSPVVLFFIKSLHPGTSDEITNLYNAAVLEDAVVNFVMSAIGKIGLVNINLEMPVDIAFQEPISFAWEQKNYFEDKYEDIFVGVAGSAQFSHNFQSTSESDA